MIRTRKICVFLMILFCSIVGVWGESYTWTGLVDDAWTNAGNWKITSDPDPNPAPNPPQTGDTAIISGGTINAGTVTVGTLTITAGTVTIGTLNANLTMSNGTLILSGGTITSPNLTGGTVEFTGTGTGLAGITSFYNLTIRGTGFQTLSAGITVGGTLTNNGTLNLAGNSIANASLFTNTGTLNAYGNETIGSTITSVGGNVVIDGTGTETGLAGFSTFTGSLTINDGARVVSGGSLNVSGTLYVDAPGTLTIPNNSIIGNITGSGSIDIAGANLTVTGIWDIQNVSAATGSTVTFSGNTPVPFNPRSQTFENITITAGSTRTLTGTISSVSSVTNNGTFNLNGNNITTVTSSVSNAGTLRAQGSETIGGVTNLGGTVEFTGTGTHSLCYISTFVNLQITGNGTQTAGGSVTVSNTFSMSAGILDDTGAQTLTISGAATQTGGSIRFTNLVLNGNGAYNFPSTNNDVDTISTDGRAPNSGGAITFTDSDDLAIGTGGITTDNANISLKASSITFSNTLNAGNAIIKLDTTDAFTYTGGNLTAMTLIVVSGGAISFGSSPSLGSTRNLILIGNSVDTTNIDTWVIDELAIRVSGDVSINLNAASVGKIAIEAGGNITVQKDSGGIVIGDFNYTDLSLNVRIRGIGGLNSAQAGIVTLDIDDPATITQENITTKDAWVNAATLILNGSGKYTLNETTNNVGILHTNGMSAGEINFVNGTALTIGDSITNGILTNAPVSLSVGNNKLTINNEINAGTGTVTLASNGTGANAVTQAATGVITAGTLVLNGNNGTYQLMNALNQVGTLHTNGASTGEINFVNNADLTIGDGGTNGILTSTTNAPVSLSVGNNKLTINNLINAGTGTVTLSSIGTGVNAVTQAAAGVITAGALVLDGNGGTYNLGTANNAVTSIGTGASTGTGAISFRDDSGFMVGTASYGIRTNAANVTLTSNIAVTQNANANAAIVTSGALILNGAGSYTLNNTANEVGAISTGTRALGTGGAISFTNSIPLFIGDGINGITTANPNTNVDVALTVDSYTFAANGFINVGTGTVQIAPFDKTKSIAFGDTNSVPPADVYYSTGLSSNIIAASLIIGRTEHTGTIYLTSVTAAPYNLTLINDATGGASRINIDGNYAATNKSLTLTTYQVNVIGSGTTRTINLGASAFAITQQVDLQNTFAISAFGGITFGNTITANSAGQNLTLTAGGGDISITGAVGSGTALGDISIVSANNLTFNSTVAAASFTQLGAEATTGITTFAGGQNYSGNFSFNGRNLTVNAALTATGDISVVNGNVVSFNNSVNAASFTQSAANTTTGTTTFNGIQTYTGNFSFTGRILNVNNALSTGGSVAIDNSGLFTKNATGTITADAGFSQTGTGTNSIGANITTVTQDLSFATSVVLTQNVTFSTGATGTDNIILSGNITGNRNLTLTAGSGNITVSGTVGTAGTRLGTITINNANIVNFSNTNVNAIYAVYFTQLGAEATTGITTFAGGQNYSGNFSFNGRNLTVNAALTATGDIRVVNGNVVSFNSSVNATNFTQQAANVTTGTTTFAGGQNYSGNFSFTGRDLTVSAALAATGNITVVNGNVVSFNNSVNAASFTQSAANTTTGTTTFDNIQTYTNNFSFTGNILNVNDALSTDGSVAIANSGLFTTTATGTITADAGFSQTGTGTNRIGASITTDSSIINFTAAIEITLDGTVTFSTGTGAGTIGDISLNGAVTHAGGTTKNLTLTAGTGNVAVVNIGAASPNDFSQIVISGRNIDLNGNIYSAGNVQLTGSNETEQTGSITASILVLDGIGNYILNNNSNAVGTIHTNGVSTGGINFINSGDFIVGVGTNGIQTNNNAPVTLKVNSGKISIVAPIITAGTGTVTLTSTGTGVDTTTQTPSGTITANVLILNGSGDYTLTSANRVTSINTGGQTAGTILFTNNQILQVGAITAANVTLLVTGTNNITGTGAIIAGTGTVTLTSSGTVNYPTGIITTNKLVLNGVNGTYKLDDTAHAVTSLNTDGIAVGEINFKNNTSLTIGDGSYGISTNDTTDDENITLTANGFSFAANAFIDAGTAEITLNTQNNPFNDNGADLIRLSASTVKIDAGTAALYIPAGSDLSGITNTFALVGRVNIDNTVNLNMHNLAINSGGTSLGALSLLLGANVSRIAVHHNHNITITKAAPTDLAIANFVSPFPIMLAGIQIPATAANRTITLTTAGAVSQEASAPLVAQTLVLNGAGSYELTQTSNNIAVMHTGVRTGGGFINFSDSRNFTLGNGTDSIITTNADITLNIVPDNTITLNADISTGNGNIAFGDNVVLQRAIAIISVDRNITFSGTINGTQNLTLNAGSGNITVTGDVGNATPLGAIIVTNANNVSFNSTGMVRTASFTQSAGGGTTKFEGTQTYSGTFGFIGTNLTVNAAMTASGTATVTSSGLFTTKNASGNITAHGGFSQNGAGTNSIGANIITTGTNINFDKAITLTNGNALFSTGTGSAGNIDLKETLGASISDANLTLESGSGNITLVGTAGSGTALGALSISNVNDVRFMNTVTAASFTQTAGTGTTTFDGAQNYSADYSFIGNNLTINEVISITGTANINNSGVFEKSSAGDITAAGGFTQTGTGTNNIGANLTTIDTNISFASPIILTLDGTTTFSTGAGTIGDITLNNSITPAVVANRNLVLEAGTGTLTLAAIGAPDNNSDTVPEWFSTITISGSTVTLNGNVYSEGLMRITAIDAANPAITNNAVIHTGPVADDVNAIEFHGNYINETAGRIVGSSSTNPNIIFKNDVIFNNNNGIDLQGDTIKFEGALPQNFNPGENLFAGTIVIANADGVMLTGSKGAQNGKMFLQNGELTIDDSSAWLLDTSKTSLSATVGFSGVNGTLSLGDTSNNQVSIRGRGFRTASGNFIVETAGSGKKTIFSSGNIIVDGSTDPAKTDLSFVDFEMIEAGDILFHVDAGNNIAAPIWQIKSLTINDSTVTLDVPLSVLTDIIFNSGVLDISTSNYPIVLGRHWINNTLSADAFIPRSGTVHFTASGTDRTTEGKPAIYIYGSTTWWNFSSETASAIVIHYARNNSNIVTDVGHAVKNEWKVSTTDAAERTLLTKMFDADYNAIGKTPPADGNGNPSPETPSTHRSYFWNINIFQESINFKNVTVKYSWSDPHTILVLFDRFASVDATPYLADFVSPNPYDHVSHYCVGWTKGVEFIYSYTEDSDHNGRIDRLRIQTAVPFRNDFSAFTIEVEGYKVKGYQNIASSPYLFHVLLEEQSYADSGNTPKWKLISNQTLTEDILGEEYFLTVTEIMIPIDTSWPVVSYSLMHPKTDGERQDLFIQFSEPVSGVNAGDIEYLEDNFIGQSLTRVSQDEAGNSAEYLIHFNLNDKVEMDDMAAGKQYQIHNASSIFDYKHIGPDQNLIAIGYPRPIYPDDENYSGYTTYIAGDNPVPAVLLTSTSRITDVLISIPPASSSDNRFFAWPVFGRDEIGFRDPFQPADQIDLVAIRKFDGTATLRDMDIMLDVTVNPLFSPTPDLILGAGIPDSQRGSHASVSKGLWLPYNSGLVPSTKYFGIPKFEQYQVDSVSSGNLVYYALKESHYNPDDMVDFFFSLPGFNNLVAGRLDGSTNGDWYRRIKPFSFKVKEFVLQRGGATILNNVINPTKGEKVYLDYTLTKGGQVTVQVFTLDGNMVQVLYRGSRSPGDYMESWDGTNRGGRVVARGMYFIRIVGPGIDEIRKVMVVK